MKSGKKKDWKFDNRLPPNETFACVVVRSLAGAKRDHFEFVLSQAIGGNQNERIFESEG